MANYYWANVQSYVEHMLIEYVDNFEDDDDRSDFVNQVMFAETVRKQLRNLVEDMLENSESVKNNELMLAILNSCDWNEVFQSLSEYLYNEYPECVPAPQTFPMSPVK